MKWKNEIKALINRKHENGGPFWSRSDGNILAPAGFCTIDVLHAIGQLGGKVTASTALRDAANFLLTYQNDDGSFSYSQQTTKLPCNTANILSTLGRLGVSNSKPIDLAYSWLFTNQAPDGGWRCATVKRGKSPETNASNPGTTLWVLDACLFRDNDKQENKQLNRGVNFLLDHWNSRKPLGPCTFGIGSRFLKTEFPFRRYNLFYYVYVLSQYEDAVRDHRLHQAFEALKLQAKNGGLRIRAPHKAWKGSVFAPEIGPSRPSVEYWRELTKRLDVQV
jgi:hypothetical protein